MKPNRGCGCLLLALALVDLVFLVSALVSAASGSTKWLMAAVVLLVMGGNLAVCVVVGLEAFSRRGRAGTTADETDLGDSEDPQGTDSETDDTESDSDD